MKCVVCEAAIDQPVFANAWEAARKLSPCCSAACAARFDPDVHWLPAVAPAAVALPEEARLAGIARARLRAGDKPTLVVRDALVSGVGIPGVRKLLIDAEVGANADDRVVRRLNVLGFVKGLLGGGFSVHERRSKQEPEALSAAMRDLETWAARFG